MKTAFLSLFLFFIPNAYSQQLTDTLTGQHLQDVMITAYGQRTRLLDVPAPVNYTGKSALDRFSYASVLPAVNATPGVKMEERSPGSYRLNIRGSSQRSPFGVRNVKVYYNDIPFTDPAGHTHLNQIGFYSFQSIEIIKGPASSLYGTGTGGAMLINTLPQDNNRLQLDYTLGSYDRHTIHAAVQTGRETSRNIIRLQHHTDQGYRQHTAFRRSSFTWDASLGSNTKSELNAHFLYSNLYYQTPGALTFNEYLQDPRAPRPATGNLPGAAEAKAAIYLETFLAGATYLYRFQPGWKLSATLYGMNTQHRNPTFRNYGRNSEPHFGGRAVLHYDSQGENTRVNWQLGMEVQNGNTSATTYGNNKGNPDTLQTFDEIDNRSAFVFSQASYHFKQWILTAGISLAQLKLQVHRFYPSPYSSQRRTYNNEFSPRLAVLRKLNKNHSAYASVSKGFSPPTSSEVVPSGGAINTQLDAEQGYSYDLGMKGGFLKNALFYNISAFYFTLVNTIVQRRDATGGDYFINAGSTRQTGVETYLAYSFTGSTSPASTKAWISHTWHHFRFREFRQLTNDYSGKQMPSIAPHSVSAGFDLVTTWGLGGGVNYFYSQRAPLNDANTVYASSYHVVNTKLSYRVSASRLRATAYLGVDNLLNVKYSLGNDINAFGARYYNVAPARNYYAGLSFSLQ